MSTSQRRIWEHLREIRALQPSSDSFICSIGKNHSRKRPKLSSLHLSRSFQIWLQPHQLPTQMIKSRIKSELPIQHPTRKPLTVKSAISSLNLMIGKKELYLNKSKSLCAQDVTANTTKSALLPMNETSLNQKRNGGVQTANDALNASLSSVQSNSWSAKSATLQVTTNAFQKASVTHSDHSTPRQRPMIMRLRSRNWISKSVGIAAKTASSVRTVEQKKLVPNATTNGPRTSNFAISVTNWETNGYSVQSVKDSIQVRLSMRSPKSTEVAALWFKVRRWSSVKAVRC